MDLEARKRIVERHVLKVRWEGEMGFGECPGVWQHTHLNQPRDCKIYISGRTVTVSCFHESCEEQVRMCNRAIRSELAGLPGELTKGEQKEYAQEAGELSVLAGGILKKLDEIYSRFWRGPELLARALSPEESQAAFWELHSQEDILWVGEVHHSGVPYGVGHFRSVGNWKQSPRLWPYTCTGVFGSEGNAFRAKAQVIRQDYNVLEFDKLDPDPRQNQLKSIAFYFYLAETFGLQGRVAVDSGHKSIHVWVKNDSKLFDDSFRLFLKMLGADPAGLRPYQPVRFPGMLRADTNKSQSLMVL